MSVVFLRSNGIRSLVAAVCLFSLTAAAPQANTGSQTQAPKAPQNTQQAATPDTSSIPSAPESRLPQPFGVDYSRPAPFLPNPFARYIPRDVPPPAFTNAPKLRELIKNGKVMLSLNDAIAVALADNLDIAIARYNLPIADTDIMLTKAGGSPRGVNAGVVSNTPGGGVGGIGSGVTGAGAGGTTAGAGGAGGGAGGIVASTSGAGPQPDSFDPVLSGTLQLEQTASQSNFALIAGLGGTGLATSRSHNSLFDLTYTQGFSPGTALTISFNNQRQSSNAPAVSFNPVLVSSFRAQVRQHLLQGFGPSLNTRLIRQAKNNKNIGEEGFRQQVISTVSQIENIYWDLVNAYEDVRVKERSLGLAQKTLSDNQKQVQIGTLAPLDVVRAQSSVSAAEQDLIVSKTTLQLQQLTMKNALTRNLPTNAEVMQMDVVPTDTVQVPEQENLPAVDQLIKMALDNRPDYKQQLITLKNSEINIQGAKNGLLPALDLVGFYGGSGIGGSPNPLNPSPGISNIGFNDVFGNLFNSTAPDKGVALNLQIPLGNRAAQATQVRSMLEYRQSQLGLKSLENQIAIAVRNDQFTVDQNRARVVAARQARELAAQTLDAEQKKYNLGASTYLAVLQDERDLAQAESNLLSSMTNYAKSRVQLDKDTAQTLERTNIKIDEAVTGNVKTQPAVPGTVANPNAIQDVNNPSGQQPKPQMQQ